MTIAARDEAFLDGKALRARYGCSRCTIWRWRNSAGVNFPQPDAHIAGRPFWRLSTIAQFEARKHPGDRV